MARIWTVTACALALCSLGLPTGRTTRAESTAAAGRQRVLANFEGGRVTLGDYEQALRNRAPSTRKHVMSSDRAGFLRDLVDYELLIAEARRRGYDARADVREAAAQAAIDRMIAHDLALSPEAIDAAEVAAYYEQHAARFRHPERRRATLIQLDSQQEAGSLRKALSGKTHVQVAAVAREKSTHPTRRMGGELGAFDREGKATRSASARVDKALADAVFALDAKGELTQPLAYDGGFALLMLTGIEPERVTPLSEAEPEIRETLADTRRDQRLESLIEQLRAKHTVTTHPELLDAIELQPPPARDRPAGAPAAPRDPRAAPRIVEDDGA